jgi:hypothetical protein
LHVARESAGQTVKHPIGRGRSRALQPRVHKRGKYVLHESALSRSKARMSAFANKRHLERSAQRRRAASCDTKLGKSSQNCNQSGVSPLTNDRLEVREQIERERSNRDFGEVHFKSGQKFAEVHSRGEVSFETDHRQKFGGKRGAGLNRNF